MNTRFKRPIFAAVLAAGVLVFCEGALQVTARLVPPVGDLLAPPWRAKATPAKSTSLHPMLVEDTVLRYRGNPDYSEHDLRGFRNAGVPEHAAIVALGDSQTYGVNAEREEAWPQQLAHETGWTTYNMGLGGWGPAQCLALLPEALTLKPRIVVLAVYAGNDLFDCYDFVHVRGQLPELRPADPAVTVQLAALEAADPLRAHVTRAWPLQDASPSPAVAAAREPLTLRTAISEHSKLYGLVRALKDAARPHAAFADSMSVAWNRLKADAAAKPDSCLIIDTPQVRTLCRPAYRLCALDQDEPRIAEGRRIAGEAIRLLHERCTAAGVKLLVVEIPTKEYALHQFVAPADGEAAALHTRLVAQETALWQTLRAQLAAEGIPCVDAGVALAAAARTGPQPFGQDYDDHPNAQGYQAIADAVRQAIETQGLLR